MNTELEALIKRYENHLQAGERYLVELRSLKLEKHIAFENQLLLNRIWKIVIKDLKKIADKQINVNQKKTSKY